MKNARVKQDAPFASKSSVFFERYAHAENENVQLRLVAGLAGLLFVIVMTAFVYSATRPQAVYYVPGAVSAGLAYPDLVPLSSVRSFALAWLTGWLNYTPETIEGVYARSLKFMSPALLSQVRGRSTEELEKVRRDRLSSVFMLAGEPEVEAGKGGFKVTVDGKRGIYMGKEELSFEPARYVVNILQVPATEDNPYALSVTDIRKEEVSNEGE